MKGLLVVCFVLLVVSARHCVHANQGKFDCKRDLVLGLAPCKPFLTGDVKKPGEPCCKAVQNLDKLCRSMGKKERVDACNCLKNPKKAKQIPNSCKVNISIDPNVDCSKA